mmetsp:Transcript_2668/g.9034  ORF Transcript_2668/g.9034 Transcript_2668/m.9034 type:complete len:479 (-) Transcript_2668:505-1941(-)
MLAHGPAGALGLRREVEECEHAVDVDDRHARGVAVELHHLRAAAQHQLGLGCEVWEAVAADHPALPPDEEERVRRAHRARRVARVAHRRAELLGPDVLLGHLVDVEHALAAVLAAHGGARPTRVHRSELGHERAVLPHVHDLLARHDHMVRGHAHVHGLNLDILGVQRGADGVAEDKDVLPGLLALGGEHAVLPARADGHQSLDVLGVAVVGCRVPEHDAVLAPLGLVERVHQRVLEVPPLVVRAHVREVDVRVHGQRDAQAAALPRERVDARARDTEGAEVLPGIRVELDHGHLTDVPVRLLRHLRPRHRQHRPRRVPGDARGAEPGINEDGLLIRLVAGQLHSPVVQAQREARRVGLCEALEAVVPVDADDIDGPREALHEVHGELRDGVPVAVVDMALPLDGAEEDHPAVRGPLHQAELEAQLLAPEPVAVHRANNHRAILVDDTDLLAIGCPLHVSHHGLVAVIDHLLEPHAFV